MDNGWGIIKTRWIDINKGDDLDVVYRSRLVGKEFADKGLMGYSQVHRRWKRWGVWYMRQRRWVIIRAATWEAQKKRS